MIAHYLIEPEQKHGMDYLAETFLNYQPVSYESLAGKKGKNQKTLRQIASEQLKDYAAEDADITLQLYQVLAPKLRESGVEQLFYDIEIPLMAVLSDMEAAGVRLDLEAIAEISETLASDIRQTEERIYETGRRKI